MNFNRVLVELTNVDSLTNDPQVDVTIYRGKDKLMRFGLELDQTAWEPALIEMLLGASLQGGPRWHPTPHRRPWGRGRRRLRRR